MRRVEVPVALPPPHQRRVQHRQQGGPRLDRRLGLEVVGQQPPGVPRLQGHGDGADVGERAAYGRLGGAQPPHQVGLGAGPEGPQPAAHQRGVALVARRSGAGRSPSHCSIGTHTGREMRQCPPLRAADQVGGEAEVGEQAGVVPAGARRDLHVRGELGEQRRGGRPRRGPSGWCRRCASTPVAGGVEPGVAVRGDAGPLHVLGDPAPLGAGDPLRGAAPRRGQQLAREDEQGAAHRQLLDEGAVVVQRALDVGARHAVDAGVQREVRRRRLGRVQDRHGAGGRDRVRQPVLRGDAVAARHPGATLRVGDQPDRLAHAAASPLTSRCCRGRPASAPRRTGRSATDRDHERGAGPQHQREEGETQGVAGPARSGGGCRCTGRWSGRP